MLENIIVPLKTEILELISTEFDMDIVFQRDGVRENRFRGRWISCRVTTKWPSYSPHFATYLWIFIYRIYYMVLI